MLSGTPGPGKSKWSSSLALSTSVYSSAITGAGLTPECFGRAVNDIGDFWECASGQRKTGGAIKVRHDPTIGIARPGKTHLRDPERVQQDSPGRQAGNTRAAWIE